MATIDYLIIGGGLAGVSAAEVLRTVGARGSVAIVSGEIDPPHDRPPLSKQFLRDERSREQVLLRPLDFYQSNRIGLVLGRPAMALKPDAHEVDSAPCCSASPRPGRSTRCSSPSCRTSRTMRSGS